MVAGIGLEGLQVAGLGGRRVAHGEVLGAELPPGPGDALPRLTLRQAGVDRVPEVRHRAVWVAAEVLESRAPAVGGQVALGRHHPRVRRLGLGVLAELEEGIAEHSGGVAVGGVELEGSVRLGDRLLEVVAGGGDKGEMADGARVRGGDLDRFLEGPLGQVEVAHVPGLPGLLDVGVTQSVIRGGIVGIALEPLLLEPDGLVRRRALGPERARGDDAQDQRGEQRAQGSKRSRAHGTSGPQGLAPASPQST